MHCQTLDRRPNGINCSYRVSCMLVYCDLATENKYSTFNKQMLPI